jgi:hypothetical protein
MFAFLCALIIRMNIDAFFERLHGDVSIIGISAHSGCH